MSIEQDVKFTDNQVGHRVFIPFHVRFEDLLIHQNLPGLSAKSDGSNPRIFYTKTTNALPQADQDRQENIIEYNKIKNELYEEHRGKFAVIAKGKLQKIGDSFAEVKDVALDANHRFIFEIKEEQQVARKTRWPARLKK